MQEEAELQVEGVDPGDGVSAVPDTPSARSLRGACDTSAAGEGGDAAACGLLGREIGPRSGDEVAVRVDLREDVVDRRKISLA